ncbi:MAG TPA: DUF2254 domain-containing protein [Oceanospirillales bacterium]|nr:hypothetical protein [Oceanospirillaceae bacterium]HBS41997.1 DUF2254 domain-containing protein [Oceanospirillales bacterium]|tara:strand:+ start:3025 stop:4308 length:1284 start_codon:yes stop_codon:yes gene_type:complete
MLNKWQWLLTQLSRKLWIRASLFALVGVVTALLAAPVERLLPEALSFNIGDDSVGHILDILASSMLTVTTFSLGVMVSAYSAASNSATPRATQLVREDPVTQNVLATFLGTFLFSLVGIIALNAGMYGENDRIILFAVTVLVIVIILVAILHWIEHLSLLGRVSETTDRVETAAAKALKNRVEHPHLGARCLPENWTPPEEAFLIRSGKTGYVCHLDVSQLQDQAELHKVVLHVMIEPGSFVHPGKVMVAVIADDNQTLSDQEKEQLECGVVPAITMDKTRSFDQDPRFGLSVLSEIASRALSPGINDPGTAIDVLGRAVRLFCIWQEHQVLADDDERIVFPRVRVGALKTEWLVEDVFMPIARDGAGMIEIQVRLQKSMSALSEMAPDVYEDIMNTYADRAIRYAEPALKLPEEVEQLKAIQCGKC